MAGSPQSTAHSSATASIFKRHKLSNEEAKFNTTIDRISTLPDLLLSHILSFLPIKLAVATSILSTRWKYLWTLVTTLDFGDDEELPDSVRCDGGMKFAQFVNRVLLLRNSASCIKKFRLPCATKCISFHFDAWVCGAITRGIEELELWNSPGGLSLELPRRLFTCKTLVVLRLRNMFSLIVPSSVNFPSLKIFYLENVKKLHSDSVKRLISGCPVLENLFLETFSFDDNEICNIFAPSLKNLTISCEIEAADNIFFENLSSLVEANVDVCGQAEEMFYGDYAFHLMGDLYNVKLLSLSLLTMETLKYAHQYDLPMFHHLTKLDITVWFYNWDVLPNLLERSPNLEVLSLTNKNLVSDCEDACWRQPQHVPKCLSLHLTTIDISGFEGLEGELKLGQRKRKWQTNELIACLFRCLGNLCRKPHDVEFLFLGSALCLLEEFCSFAVLSCIKRFSLQCGSDIDSFNFNTWVCGALTRGVEELDLSILSDQPVELSRHLFNCKELVVLKLYRGIFLDIPSWVHFPCLKILHLDNVGYPDSDSIQKLISGCPILEDLLLVTEFFFLNEGIVNINAPALKNLTIGYVIVHPEFTYSIENLSSLVEAHVGVGGAEKHDEHYGNCAFQLLRGLYNVKFLSLYGKTMQTLKYASSYDMPMFHNLTRLEITGNCWHMVPNFLESSHNLEVLSLEKYHVHSDGDACWRQPQRVPKCLSSHLTKFAIEGFNGLKDELRVTRYILKNAKVLKMMRIYFSSLISTRKLRVLKKKISKFGSL